MNKDSPTSLQVGMLVKDNDPRPGWQRVLRIEGFVQPELAGRRYAILGNPKGLGRTTRVMVDRIHLDGKQRRTGWSVVP